MGCLCALTFFVVLSFNNVALDAVYGKPLRCVQGTFHYDTKADALVFQRKYREGFEQVSIPLPHANIQGRFQVFYCWGEAQAVFNGDEVPVLLSFQERGVA